MAMFPNIIWRIAIFILGIISKQSIISKQGYDVQSDDDDHNEESVGAASVCWCNGDGEGLCIPVRKITLLIQTVRYF